MRKFLLVATAMAAALILSARAFAENNQSHPQQNQPIAPQVVEGASNSSTVPKPDGTPSKGSELAKEAEPSTLIQSAEDVAATERLRDLVENNLRQYVPRGQDRDGITEFYSKRSFVPLWVSAGKLRSQGQQAMEFLRGVAADGLDPQDYPTPRFVDPNPSRLAADELTLTNSIATFVRHASTGRVAFTRVSGSIYFDLKTPDLEQVLSVIAASDDIRTTLDSFNPQQPQYKALKSELASARRSQGIPPDIAGPNGQGKAARRKDQSDQVARIDTITANMERWRWLPHEVGAAYVMVNIPDYALKVVNLGSTVWSTRIVVGKAGNHATPLLAETMKYITFNPTWNVPPSIIRNEYLPALERDPTALARIGLRIGRNNDGSIRIYQPPSERNALGRIRFNFPNRFLVYQHDTPDKYLFEKTARAYSHGCMRVEKPDQYAEVLLSISQPEDGFSAQRIRALYGAGERNINLKNPIPVYLTYQTAFVDDTGQLQIRPDIYGLDQAINDLLRGAPEVADIPIARSYSSDSTPVLARLRSRQRYEVVQQPYGWERSWTPNYFQSRQNNYEQFERSRWNYFQSEQSGYGQFGRNGSW